MKRRIRSPSILGFEGSQEAGSCAGNDSLEETVALGPGPRHPQESFPEEALEAASAVRSGCASCCSCFFIVVVENEGLAVPLNSPQLSVHLASLQGWLSSPTSGPVPELSSTGEAWKFPLLPSL